MDKLSELASLVASRINAPRWHYLQTPLTSANWNGNARSTTGVTVIDLSTEFGVPSQIKAVRVRVAARDSASAGGTYSFELGSTSGFTIAQMTVWMQSPNDRINENTDAVACNSDGDIYFKNTASGVGTMDVFIYVTGYYL